MSLSYNTMSDRRSVMCMDILALFSLLLKPNYPAHLALSKHGNTVFDTAPTLGLHIIFISIAYIFYKAILVDLY